MLVDVPVGSYTLKVQYIGYAPKLVAVQVTAEGLAPLKVELKPTVLSGESVTITAQAEMLEARRSGNQQNYTLAATALDAAQHRRSRCLSHDAITSGHQRCR